MRLLCRIVGCDRAARAKELCGAHYMRKKMGRPMLGPIREHHERCQVPGCGRKHLSKGYCSGHLSRVTTRGRLDADIPIGSIPPHRRRATCQLQGCDRPHEARGYCELHYKRMKRTGQVGAAATMTVAANDADALWRLFLAKGIHAHGRKDSRTPGLVRWELCVRGATELCDLLPEMCLLTMPMSQPVPARVRRGSRR